jgi:hypothetical protein
MTRPTPGDRDNRVLPATRVLAFVIVPILTVAWVMLWIFPNRSADFFSWPVKPSMSAMMLGATYLGGAWFFGVVVVSRAWHAVTLGFLPVSAFAGILGVATVLHWGAFTAGHPSFILWAILYFSLPFVIPVVWWRNARHDPGSGVQPGAVVGDPVRWIVGGLGSVLAVVSAVLVVAPDLLIPTWPWTLTPLTARVLGAMFALSGIVGIEIAIDRRPAAARAIVQAQAIAIAGILAALVRASGDVAWDRPTAWLFAGGMLVVLAANVLAAYGRRRGPGSLVGGAASD